ncbi:MAG: insulinase family protein, partial [Alphaproteobacteria bacterium]|nr:insulinase family protein [Alphaproteobacteria bacterium]
NAILVVAGDVEVDEVRALAEKHYGVLPSRDVPPRSHPQEPPSWAARELEMTHEQATQPNWTRTWLAPSYQHGRSEHAPALQVLSEILGGGTTSRLYQKLVVEDGLAVSLSSWYRPQALGPATFGVSITPSDGNIELLAEAVAQEIELLRREGPSDQELSRAKRQLTASAIFVQDDISGLANVVGSALASGRSIDDLRRWPSEIEAITAADISAAIDYVFRDNRAVTGRLLPAPESAASKEAGQ